MREEKRTIDRTLRRYTAAYTVSLALIAGLAMVNHVSTVNLVTAYEDTRRMSDQVIRLSGLAHDLSGALARPNSDLAVVDQWRAEFGAGHAQLKDFLDERGVGDAALDQAAAEIMAGATPGAAAAARMAMVRLDTIHASEMNAKSARMASALQLERMTFLSLLTVLAGVGFLIFRPLGRRLRRNTRDLIAAHDELSHALRHNSLTGLPNRRYLREFLAHTITQARKQSMSVAVFQFDLIGFRSLNKLLGESMADEAIRHAADALKGAAKKGDFVARIGPDEFCVVQPSGGAPGEVEARALQMSRSLSRPFEVRGAPIELHNVSAATISSDLMDADMVLKNTSLALAAAKARGPGAFSIYTEEMRIAFEAKEKLRVEIKAAFDNDEFEPYFQPQVCARTGRVDGFEALARWRHPERGVLTPYYFLYAAAEFGVGDKLDELIMEKSMDALAGWRAQGLDVPRVGVNFASEQLADPFMVEKIRWAAEQRGLEPDSICIEILETVLMEDEGAETVQNIEALGRAGFRIDLDDFGTGHASISTLQQVKTDRIKIDRSFVTDLPTREECRKVVSAMIELAHGLDTEVLAEGVETDEEFGALQALGCDYVQGFGIARPMPSREVPVWLRKYNQELRRTLAQTAG